MFIGAF